MATLCFHVCGGMSSLITHIFHHKLNSHSGRREKGLSFVSLPRCGCQKGLTCLGIGKCCGAAELFAASTKWRFYGPRMFTRSELASDGKKQCSLDVAGQTLRQLLMHEMLTGAATKHHRIKDATNVSPLKRMCQVHAKCSDAKVVSLGILST